MPASVSARAETRRRAAIELLAVAVALAAYVVAEEMGAPKRWTFAAADVALGAYAVVVARRGGETWRDFGLRADNLRQAALPIGAATLCGAALIAGWAVASGAKPWRDDLAILLPVYPLWGVVQQLLFQGVVHRRLRELLERRWLAFALTAVAFGLVHWGNDLLVVLTVLAGLLWSLLFDRWPNVWLLGASHGILAALAYPMVLGDAPLSRM